MNLFKLKQVRFKNKFRRKLSKLSDNRVVSEKKIKSVGILTTAKVLNETDLQLEVEKILGVRNSKIYGFKEFDKNEEVSFKYFSEKDINWKGEFSQTNFESFLEQPFDLLIGYFDKNHLFLEKAVLDSKASFKVGFSNVNSKLYELEIHTAIENIKIFSLELSKYLTILKKI